MFNISRCVLRWGLISGLALGGVTLLIGPQRVAGGLAHLRTKAQSLVDQATDNPMALRRQLEVLADEYPQRIGTVEAEIAEVDYQIGEYKEDCEVAQRVVAMASDDVVQLKSLITRADDVPSTAVFIRFEGIRFDMDQARNEARRINRIMINYQDRVACNRQQLDMLQQQKARLVEIFNTLTDEFATFQTQTWQLDRQIDAIERNERLIEMTRRLQATLDTYDQWGKVGNLKQLEQKLAELRRFQEAQIRTLQQAGVRQNYEDRARFELEMGQPQSSERLDDFLDGIKSDDEATETSANSMAFLGPVIVE